ncbi:TadE/TadG family type IV pilus assembly protein [Asticcacaulis solisilvae]|uniref:TadE/TadG family type IV pilus assembly protein n=1 Tax=Asticcacaulis solisilvae TaxID=1217274 RepID=UPI003FD7631C
MGILRRLANMVRLRSFVDDRRGVSAVEFALIAPILIMIYLALAELTLGMMASRRTSHLAATIGDLAAQSENLTNANITDLWAIATSMMQPFDTGTILKMRLTSVTMGSDSKARVNWSQAQNMTPYTANAVITTISTSQIASGESLMMTEVEYDYTSPIGNFLPGTSKFTDTFYHHPRNGQAVTNTN